MPTHRFARRDTRLTDLGALVYLAFTLAIWSVFDVAMVRAQASPEPPPSAAPPPDAGTPVPPPAAEPQQAPPPAVPDLQVRELPQAQEGAVVAQDESAEPEDIDAAPLPEDVETPAAENPPPEADMVVTGSRIKRKDLTGSAAIKVISREQIIQSGRTNVGEFLQTIPEQSNAIGRGTNNGGDGSILVNLRGIGAQSTLVLLNGRRLAPGGTGADIAADLSAIPTQVIERIEVLKEGASAVYGSDAVAGVVNIITRKPFDGAEATVYGSTSTRGDGQQVDVNGTLGVVGQKGGMLISVGYYDAAPAWAGDRDYSRVAHGYEVNEMGVGTVSDLGSATIPEGLLEIAPGDVGVPNGNARYNDLIRANPKAAKFTYDPEVAGNWREFKGQELNQDGYNYQPYNYLVTPQKRFNIFASGDYKLSKWVRVFFDSFYSKRNSSQTLAPEPLAISFEGVTISKNNIYNPFGRDVAQFNRRLVEFSRRGYQQDIHNFHLTAGLDGNLAQDGPLAEWFWEGVFGFNRNEATVIKTGNVRNTRLQNALGPSFIDATGAPRCGTADSPIDGCVPLNVFGGPGSITRDQVNYLTYSGVKRGFNQIVSGQLNFGGPLFHLWSERAVGLALGYEYRALSGASLPDPITAAGETSGNKEEPTAGSYRVQEIYGELNIPLVDKMLLLHQLELTAALRASFYNNFGSTTNYKLGLRWSPIEDIAVRGTFSTAFRAPNINELYQGASDSFSSVSDPCGVNVEPGSALARNCGAAANNGDVAKQLRSRVGGNPDLQPETARIFTAGVIIRPRAAKDFSLTLDYFNTRVSNTISSIGENVIVQGCYPAADGTAPKYCGLITRDPTSQRIMRLDNRQANSGEEKLDGVDMSGTYDLDSPIGAFNLLATVAYLFRYDRTLADGSVLHGAGTFDMNSKHPTGAGKAGAFPHLRFNLGLTWALAGWSASIRSYFIGPYKECGDASGTFVGGLCSTKHQGEREVSPYNTMDLTLGYAFASDAGRTNVTVGVTNLFDVAPPRVYNGAGATTDTYAYDMLMRQIYARVGHQF